MNGLTFVALVCGILLPTSAIVAHKFSGKTKQDPTVWGIGVITGVIIGIAIKVLENSY